MVQYEHITNMTYNMNTLMMINKQSKTYMVQYEHINDDNKQSKTYMVQYEHINDDNKQSMDNIHGTNMNT